MNAAKSCRPAVVRLEATPEQLAALNAVTAYALSRRKEDLAAARKWVDYYTAELTKDLDAPSRAHATHMLDCWREHIAYHTDKVAEAERAETFLRYVRAERPS